MSKKAAQEYLRGIMKRYHTASKQLNNGILEEFCDVCGHDRQYAIRLLSNAFRRGRTKSIASGKKLEHPGSVITPCCSTCSLASGAM